MKAVFFTTLLATFVLLTGCSAVGTDENQDYPDLTGEWFGSIDAPAGGSNGLTLNLVQVGDEITGSYREARSLDNGRVLNSGGSVSGTALAADRIDIMLSDSRVCKFSLSADQLSGRYTTVGVSPRTGAVSVARR